jgi:RNA polymerase sigma factor (sigma-70 family)
MPKAPFSDILQYLRRMYPAEDAADRPDSDLLNRFVTQGEDAAFTVLLERHAAMVMGVCVRVLGDLHGAEDAFQATFVVLARRAPSIALRGSLGPWLYAVAQRIALRAKAQITVQRNRERRYSDMPRAARLDEHSWQELRSVLDEEIGRLPEKYRAPLVLCYFEGKSQDRAAKELGWAKSTLDRRLSRGRELLRKQLIRRGITLSAAMLATALCEKVAGAAVSATITINTVKAATSVLAGKVVAGGYISARALALAEEAIVGLLAMKGKLVLVVIVIGLAVGGVGWAGYGALEEQAPPDREAKTQAPAAKDQASVTAKKNQPIATDRYGDPLPEGAVGRLGSLRFRHDGDTTALVFTPDGNSLVGRTDSGVIIWDPANGKVRHRLPVLQNLVSGDAGGMELAPDGSTLAVSEYHRFDGNEEAEIAFWDLRTGKKSRTLSLPKGEAKQYYRLCFSPDGKSLAWSSANEGIAYVFDLASGQVRATIGVRNSVAVYNLAFAPDSRTVAAAVYSNDRKTFGRNHGVQIWDFNTEKVIRTIYDLPARILPDTRPIRDLPPRKPEITVGKLAFAADGNMLAIAIKDRISLVDPTTGIELGHLEAKMGQTVGLAFTGDAKKLVSAHEDGSIHVWDLDSKNEVRKFGGGHLDRFGLSMAISPDSKTVALGTNSEYVQLWDLASGKELFSECKGHESKVFQLAFSPDRKTLVSANSVYRQGQILLWDWASGQRLRVLPENAHALSFSPDGKRLATLTVFRGENDVRSVPIWDVASGKKVILNAVPDANQVRALIFSPDGQKLYTLDQSSDPQNYAVRHWNLATGKQDREWIMPHKIRPGPVPVLAADGKTVYAYDHKGDISIIDVDLGRERVLASPERVWSMTPSPDGRVLASGMDAKIPVVRLWEVATVKEICFLNGHEARVFAMAWSPDGRLLATGDGSGRMAWYNGLLQSPMFWNITTLDVATTVRVWDTAAGKELACFGGFKGGVFSLAFSPDGDSLAAGLSDTSILIWDVSKVISTFSPPPKLVNGELESYWADLAGDNAGKAHQGIGLLVAAPKQGVPFLRSRLQPVAGADGGKLQQWITDFGSNDFGIRQAAARELTKVDVQAIVPLQKALKENTSLEARRRLEQILKTIRDGPGPDTLRTIRAIMVLERIGSPEAQGVLETLAKGAPGARETEEAKASLERLAPRISKAR